MEDLKKLLNYLNIDVNLIDGELISIKKTNNVYCFNIKINNQVSTSTFELLEEKIKEKYDDCNATFCLIGNNDINEYYKYFISKYSYKDALIQMFLNVPLQYNNNILNIELDSINKSKTFKLIENQLKDDLKKAGIIVNEINIKIDNTKQLKKQEEINIKIQEEAKKTEEKLKKLEQVETKKYVKNKDESVLHGRKINTEISKLHDITEEISDISVEVEIFDIEGKIIVSKDKGKEYKIINMKLTDYTDSISSTLFVNTKEEYDELLSKLKVGKFYIMRGTFKHDLRSHELSFSPRDINISNKVKSKRIDTASETRVELHMHTMMSQMDGVISDEDVINKVADFNHNAVAITDHNGVQSFPHLYKSMLDINKKRVSKIKDKISDLEKKMENADSYDCEQLKKQLEIEKLNLKNVEKFKVIFGTEIGLIDDDVNIVIRPNEKTLDQEYVVFDLETTGFNALAGDTIIDIGAVKVRIYKDENDNFKLEEIEKYDKFINPFRKLPPKIVELTCITDEMLQDAEKEEDVIKDFKEFVGDLPMVAHNARFDCSFMDVAYKRNNLGKFSNPVLDTLELSRALDPNEYKHNLTVLAKRYKIDWNEDEHHRGDYDALNTAKILSCMLNRAKDKVERLDELNNLIDKDQLYKTSRCYHVNILSTSKIGLKNLFKIISYANTTYFYKEAKIPKSKLNELREGLLIGSGCYESEVFVKGRSKDDDEMANIIDFYDYVEVQPPDVYSHLIDKGEIETSQELLNHIRRIIRLSKERNKIIVATGDVHHFDKDDKIYRKIIVNQKIGGTGRHPLNRPEIKDIPSQHLRDTKEMLENFNFLDNDLAYEIVVKNTNKIKDMVDLYEVIEYPEVPYSPNMDKPGYIIKDVVRDMVYEKAQSIYGDPLPINIEERIAEEFYGANIKSLIIDKLKEENISEEEINNKLPTKLHEEINKGYDNIFEIASKKVKKELNGEDIDEEAFNLKVKKTLGGVIGGGFDVIYYIAQQLVKKSNDDGYIVGSRGSVGSSFVATMMGITEVNSLPAHYVCPNCKHSIFEIDGIPLGKTYSSGYDLPQMDCPKCKTELVREGQDMPFATFLGFNADKVPDIDLNFSGDYQWKAHEYTKVLFGVDNVYRAGTIGTVADKTAYGFVKGYCEDKGIQMRSTEIERIAKGCTGVKRTTGQHPGGIVVVPKYKDVFDFTPFQYPADDTSSRWRTTHFDYHAIDADLLKLDILGHDDPTVLKMLQDMSGIDFRKIDLSDKDTMGIFTGTSTLNVTPEQIMCPTGTLGIPEFGTKFTIGMLEDTKPTTFSELIKISGLSHGTDVWLGNAQDLVKGQFKLSNSNELVEVPFKEVIGCRDDIMVYLMYHGLKPFKAFKIMEFVRKGKASKDKEGWKKFEDEMLEAGIDQWFIDSCAKIKYMFPKAHAAAYVISAFRIAWFKVHKPIYYYCAYFSKRCEAFDIPTMINGYDAIKNKIIELENKVDITNKESDTLDVLRVALEASARGIKFLNFDIERSLGSDFVIDGDSLIPPFRAMDGLGGVVALKIEEEREKKQFISISDLKSRGKVPSKIIEELTSIGALKGLPESNQLSLF